MRTTYDPGCFMTVRVDDSHNGSNSGNNSDKFELVLQSEQEMTVAFTHNGEAYKFDLNKVALTIMGPMEWGEFLDCMREISKREGA